MHFGFATYLNRKNVYSYVQNVYRIKKVSVTFWQVIMAYIDDIEQRSILW